VESKAGAENKAGAQISQRAFIQSLLILLVLMLSAGVLTRVVAAGRYERTFDAGREVIDPGSFDYVEAPDYPIWRWLTAPLEVLWGPDGLTIITIIVFLLLVGISFAILDKSGLVRSILDRIVQRFGVRKYLLLLVISLFFMLMGAFFGIFEEVVPLVPVMIALSYSLGWDALVGLGMSILATNLGFSAAITNPFTIGVAQKIADLPLFSGAGLRIFIFAAIYGVFALFLTRYARRVERRPQFSPVFAEDQLEREKYKHLELGSLKVEQAGMRKAIAWLVAFMALILLVLVSGPLLPALSQYSLPLVGILFFAAGIGAGALSGAMQGKMLKAITEGAAGIAPAIPLILMAAAVKHIVAQGGIMDTILHSASESFAGASPFSAALIIYFLALFIEFFIGSGSAKAFLMMPILLPLADLVGVTRQVAVTAYCFGDGFSNLAYPTNPVLLISLGLTVVSFPKWLKWSYKLWIWVLGITFLFLAIGVAIGYGPF
jgi:uncharacterized ion transporter superfamily protein YfcC